MFTIRKEFNFSAMHSLDGLHPEHPCTREHGHNYVITVELKKEKLDHVGFVRDYRALSAIKDWINKTLDHRNLNEVMVENPTAENIAFYLYKMFKDRYPELHAVEVSETPKTMARYELS